MKGVRILLADDHTILREGLRSLLSLQEGFQVVGEAGDGVEAVRLAKELSPQVVVMDIGMPGLGGIEATLEILKHDPDIRVIGLSIHSDCRFVKGMLSAGAKGYLLKDCAADELVQAIQNITAGRVHVSPQVSGLLVEDYVRQIQRGDSGTLLSLTAREREVLRLLARGQHNKQIAQSLGLSSKTVDAHRQHIMDKLGLHSIADLTRFAIREGLVSPDG